LADLNEPAPTEEEANSQGEDIEAFVEAGAEEGLIAEEDRQLIQSVVEFGDKTVRAVMTPRPNIVSISEESTLEEFKQLVLNEKYSRIPVYRLNVDDIVGFVHVHDLFETPDVELPNRRVREIARPIRLVPETQAVRKLLDEMKRDGVHMVAVVNEYGSTAGIATMEDLVEEILGEIRDEHEPAQDYLTERPGVFVVAGSYDLDNLREHVGYERQEETEATTVGGLATEWFGRVPCKGELIDREGIRIEIMEANDLRVEKVRVMRVPEPAETPVVVKENGANA
jgi:CBS domain containing-hemolysin-like protein